MQRKLSESMKNKIRDAVLQSLAATDAYYAIESNFKPPRPRPDLRGRERKKAIADGERVLDAYERRLEAAFRACDDADCRLLCLLSEATGEGSFAATVNGAIVMYCEETGVSHIIPAEQVVTI